MATKKEIIKQKLAQADFTDDVMFGLIMAKQAIYKRFLESVLPKKVFEDIRAITQRQLKTDYVSRAGRLDLLCTTKSGEQFNVELQMTNEHNLHQRARYYHALLANHMLVVGEDYHNLKDSYVIFLCNFDHNGYGHAFTHYQTFSSRSLADSLGDGSHTIVLNAKGNWDEVNDELKGIFQLVLYQQRTLGHLGPEIASEIKYTKQTKLGGRKYMELAGTFWQEITKTSEELGIKKGREEGREKSYITLVPIFVQKLTEDGYTQDEIISYLETKIALSEEAAQKYYQLAITKA